MMATVPHVTSGLGLIKFQSDGFLLTRVYKSKQPRYMPYSKIELIAWKISVHFFAVGASNNTQP